MRQVGKYKISFLRPQCVDKVFRDLLNDDFIRKNVDEFFLYTANYYLLSRYIRQKKAIAYTLNEICSHKYLGVFLAFRKRNQLYVHSFFKKHRGANIVLTISEMVERISRYYKRNGITVSKFITHIPENNKAAIWVTRKVGGKYSGSIHSSKNGKILEYILNFPM